MVDNPMIEMARNPLLIKGKDSPDAILLNISLDSISNSLLIPLRSHPVNHVLIMHTLALMNSKILS